MPYEASYDSGLKPFIHDKDRGKWSSPKDFLFACLGHAFKIDAVLVLPGMIFREFGIYVLIPYFITLALCVVPIVFMQSFLGQFSSTGFISVFRIAPLFKGIGYVSLAINLTTLTYYSVFGAIPLFYFFHSLRPTIPWSCEGAEEWTPSFQDMFSVCSKNVSLDDYSQINIPSMEFFKSHLNIIEFYDYALPERTFSWPLVGCAFIIWGIIAAVVTKPTEVIGRYLRYSCVIVLGIMSICALRLAFLPGVSVSLRSIFLPKHFYWRGNWPLIPFMAFSALGPGWGSILTMASFNKFKANIHKYSWLLCAAQIYVTLGLAGMSMFVRDFIGRHDPEKIYTDYITTQWMEFLIIPSVLTLLEMPHFWSLLFFAMLTLGSLNLLIVQFFSVLTSLFDEYVILRRVKREVTLGTVGVLALASIYFCSNHGVAFFEILMKFSIMTQMGLNLLLLLMVLWVYGRERFQRDLHFMTSRTYSTWMVNIVRFVAPLFLFLGWFIGYVVSMQRRNYRVYGTKFHVIIGIIVVPWFIVPGYCIYKIMQTSGMLGMRLRRSVRPTDWYPVESVDRQRYEVTFSNTDISQQLTVETVTEE